LVPRSFRPFKTGLIATSQTHSCPSLSQARRPLGPLWVGMYP